MKITLKSMGFEYDITKYVDKPFPQSDSVGDVFSSAQIVIPFIKHDELLGIDLAYKIPRLSQVEITDIEDTRHYYVISAEVEKLNNNESAHTLELKGLPFILQFRPIPDFSVTQPTLDGELFVTETSDKNEYALAPFMVDDTFVKVALNDKIISEDTSVIEHRTLKRNGTYKLTFEFRLDHMEFLPLTVPELTNFTVQFRADGNVIHSHNFGLIDKTNAQQKRSVSFDYENTGNNEIEVYLNCGYNTLEIMSNAVMKTSALKIVYEEVLVGETIYLDYVADKILGLVNINSREFTLDETTRSRLSQVKAYETMETDVTLYDALNKIANYVKAKVRMMPNKVIWFEYYEDMALKTFTWPLNDGQNIVSEMNEYTSAFELKNNNIVKSNFMTERLSLRTKGTAQITTENILLPLSFKIDKIKKVEVRGKEWKDDQNNVIVTNDEWVDITQRVVLKDYYDTLSKKENYLDREENNQNNHLYYTRGGNEINGLSFTGLTYETWLSGQDVNRALHETIACVLAENHDMPIRIDGGLSEDLLLEFRVDYYVFGESNALIHKDDQTGFEDIIVRKINANDRVNNADLLGAYVRTKVNAIGGTRLAISDTTNEPNKIAKLGSKNGDYLLPSVTKFSGHDDIRWVATAVKDYIYESEYVGIDSDRRLYEVPKTDYVDRVDKSLALLELSKENMNGNQTIFNLEGLMSILTTSAGSFVPPKLAHATYDEKEVSTYVDVNALGTTVEFRMKMYDNFSAGFKRDTAQISGQSVTFQKGVPYVNFFGVANVLDVNYMAFLTGATISELNQFPEGQDMGSGLMGGFSYFLNKDARERHILSAQISFISNDGDIRIYDGLAKFNRQVLNEINNIKLVKLGYIPHRYDKVLDVSRVEVLENLAVLHSNYIEFNAENEGDYAWYDERTDELLLVYLNATSGLNRVYFKGVNYGSKDTTFIPVHAVLLGGRVNVVATLDEADVPQDSFNESVSIRSDIEPRVVMLANLSTGINTNYQLTESDVPQDSFNENVKITSDVTPQQINNVELRLLIMANAEIFEADVPQDTFNESVVISSLISPLLVINQPLQAGIQAQADLRERDVPQDSFSETVTLWSQFEFIPTETVTLGVSLIAEADLTEDDVPQDSFNEVVEVGSSVVAVGFEAVELGVSIGVYETLTEADVPQDSFNETIEVGTEVNAIIILSSGASVSIVVEKTLLEADVPQDSFDENVTVGAEVTGQAIAFGNLKAFINVNATLTEADVPQDSLNENVSIGVSVTAETDMETVDQIPVVTTLMTHACGYIKFNVANNNTVSVTVFFDSVYMGLISANSNKDFVVSHALTGGGTFIKNIRFWNSSYGMNLNYLYQETIPSFCSSIYP